MSFQAMAWAYSQKLPDSESKLVLLALANYADQDNRCWPSIERLSNECALSPNTIRHRIDQLSQRELIRVAFRKDDIGRNKSHLFTLLVDTLHPVKATLHGVKSTLHHLKEDPAPGEGSYPAPGEGDPISTDPITEPSTALGAFERFWKAYPNKKSKGDAEHAFIEVGALAHLEKMLQAIALQVTSEDWLKENGKYIPNPGRWLRDKRWLDQPVEKPPAQEEFNRPTSQRYRIEYAGGKFRYYTRTDGGPKREHFGSRKDMDNTFDCYRVDYQLWLKECEAYDAEHAR